MRRILQRLIQRHHQQIEIRPQLAEPFGKAVTPPAPQRATTGNNFAQIVRAGVTQYRFGFIGFREGRGFRAQLLRQL